MPYTFLSIGHFFISFESSCVIIVTKRFPKNYGGAVNEENFNYWRTWTNWF